MASNRHFWHEMETDAAAEAVWALWMDVGRWGDWDQGLQSAELHGAMAAGATGVIVDSQGRRSRFAITELVPGQLYEFATRLPLGALVVRRSFVQRDPCRFRHDVRFTGAGGWALSGILGPDFRARLPPTMAALSALAAAR